MKALLLGLFILINGIVNAQLKTKGSIETGVTNWSYSMFTKSGQIQVSSDNLSFYSIMSFDVYWKVLHLNNTIESFADKSRTSNYFTPLLVVWTSDLYVELHRFKIGVSHSCTHPVFSVQEDRNTNLYRASYNRIFIKYEFGND